MDALFKMMCSVFRDFVDGKIDSMKFKCAVDAYTKIVEVTPVGVSVDVFGGDDGLEDGADAVDESHDELDAGADDVETVEGDFDDDVIAPNVDVDTSGDARGETVEVIVGSKVVEKLADEEAPSDADAAGDASGEASGNDDDYDVMADYRDV